MTLATMAYWFVLCLCLWVTQGASYTIKRCTRVNVTRIYNEPGHIVLELNRNGNDRAFILDKLCNGTTTDQVTSITWEPCGKVYIYIYVFVVELVSTVIVESMVLLHHAQKLFHLSTQSSCELLGSCSTFVNK